jgi:hypothetical protein
VRLILFLIALVLGSAMNVIVWRQLRRVTADAPASWRRLVAYLGIATNSFAFAIPVGHLIYTSILLNGHRLAYAPDTFNGLLVTRVSSVFALLTMVLGAMSPKNVRLQLMFSAGILICFWLPVDSLTPLGTII